MGDGDIDMAVLLVIVSERSISSKSRSMKSVFSPASTMRWYKDYGRKRDAAELDTAELEMLQSRFNSLSFRQRQVMELAVAGLSFEQRNRERSLRSARKLSRTIVPGSWSGSARVIWQNSCGWRCKSSCGRRAASGQTATKCDVRVTHWRLLFSERHLIMSTQKSYSVPTIAAGVLYIVAIAFVL